VVWVAQPLGDALDEQGQHAQGDVRADPVWRPVEDGPRTQATFDGMPALLDAHELLVAKR